MQLAFRKHAGRMIEILIFGLAAVLVAAAADSKPDFSGDWKLNVGKSDFGPLPGPSSRNDKIDHKDPNLKIATTQTTQQGQGTREWNCTTNGNECTNTMGPNTVRSTAKWAGPILVIESKGTFNGNDYQSTDKWTLSEDGKTLTISRHLASQMGEADQTLLMEKQ